MRQTAALLLLKKARSKCPPSFCLVSFFFPFLFKQIAVTQVFLAKLTALRAKFCSVIITADSSGARSSWLVHEEHQSFPMLTSQ